MRRCIILLVLTCIMASCGRDPFMAGGSSTTGNARVSGCVVDSNGMGVDGVMVVLYPKEYNPLKDQPVPDSLKAITGKRGEYVFLHAGRRAFNVYASDSTGKLKALIPVDVRDDSEIVQNAVLGLTGSISVLATADIDAKNGYVYIPGTDISTLFDQKNEPSGRVILRGIPQGIPVTVHYDLVSKSSSVPIGTPITVMANDTAVIAHPFWKYMNRLMLNTTQAGADISGTVVNFPVLLRLTNANFDFSQSKSDGSDIRFTNAKDNPLSYEIEKWDPAAMHAEVWVKVDTIRGNDSSQSILMYWGSQAGIAGESLSKSTNVFDTADGFMGVWHLAEEGSANALDATANHYDGTPYGMSAASAIAGAIGQSRYFDGINSYITMPNTADSKLSFSQDGYFSVSAWVSLDTFNNASHLILSKGYQQYYMRLTYFPSNSPLWEFTEFNETTNWQSSTWPATAKQWVYLTGVRQGTRQLLYCNGQLVDSTLSLYPNSFSRNASYDLSIGKFLEAVTYPTNDGYCFFKGSIDEVRIVGRVQNSDWTRLCYMNQRRDDRLVRIK